MPDWDAERRVLRLKEYAHSNQALDSDVLSLKFRFLSKPERDGQLYLGGHEYQVIDEAFERSGLEGRTLRRSKPRKYNRHESGPEILSPGRESFRGMRMEFGVILAMLPIGGLNDTFL
jgi:hypothetical protein